MRQYLTSLLALFPTLAAYAQHPPDFPNRDHLIPPYKLRKLARAASDAWHVDGLAMQYSDLGGGFFADPAGQRLYLQRYPETDLVLGVIPFVERRGRALPHGPAAFRSPDGLSNSAGTLSDGIQTGRWTDVSVPPALDVAAACPELLAGLPLTDPLPALRACFPEVDTQCQVTVTTSEFVNGQLHGPYRVETLDRRIRHRMDYAYGEPIGEELAYDYQDDSLNLRIVHEGGVADTVYQRNPPEESDETLHEQMPAFTADCPEPPRTGDALSDVYAEYQACAQQALLEFIYTNIEYPPTARAFGITGTSVVTFVIERDGSITDLRTVRHVSASIDAEARRVVAAMPPWQPGYQRGEPVRVQFNLPIAFHLK